MSLRAHDAACSAGGTPTCFDDRCWQRATYLERPFRWCRGEDWVPPNRTGSSTSLRTIITNHDLQVEWIALGRSDVSEWTGLDTEVTDERRSFTDLEPALDQWLTTEEAKLTHIHIDVNVLVTDAEALIVQIGLPKRKACIAGVAVYDSGNSIARRAMLNLPEDLVQKLYTLERTAIPSTRYRQLVLSGAGVGLDQH